MTRLGGKRPSAPAMTCQMFAARGHNQNRVMAKDWMMRASCAPSHRYSDFRLEVGAPADLVVLDALSVLEALRDHRAPVCVIRNGKVVDVETYKARGSSD